MCCSEAIGIIGAILGTILGWALNEFSKRGKLMIYPSWHEGFQNQDEYGVFVDSHTLEEASSYSYNLSIDLYNSSGDSKIMRDISIGFFQDEKELFKEIPYDDSSGRRVGDIGLYEHVRSLTIVDG